MNTVDPILAIAKIVASDPAWGQRLLDEHRRGPDGRCVSCRWSTFPNPPWPCAPRAIGERAREMMTVSPCSR